MVFPIVLAVPIVAVVIAGGVSIAAVALKIQDNKKKFKTKPKGPPRPPRGTARQDVVRIAREKLGMDIMNFYNIPFVGPSGVGKSTLINALREREDAELVPGSDHDIYLSAPTGEWQTTTKPSCYGCPEDHPLQYVRFYDMPGTGTTEHPPATYFEDKYLCAFDMIVLVAERELGEYEYFILEKAQKLDIPVGIVITKVKQKVEAKLRQRYNDPNVPCDRFQPVLEETINECRERVSNCLERRKLRQAPVFVVSAWDYRDFCADARNFIPTSVEESSGAGSINGEPLAAHADDDSRMKKALLAEKTTQLLAYIANVAHERRL